MNHLGRRRGEFEEANSKWLAYRNGTRDPRRELPSLDEQVMRLDAAFDFLNNKPINGELYGPDNARKLYGLNYWIPGANSGKILPRQPAPAQADH